MDLKALYKLSYGVYSVGSKKGDKINAQIANAIFQISCEPPTLGISINKKNLSHEFIKAGKVFTVSIHSIGFPLKVIGQLGFKSGRDINKFENLKYLIGKTGAPVILESCVSYMECELISSIDVETHTLFVGKIIEAETLCGEEPMTYDYYHKVKNGATPKNAPTYIASQNSTKEEAPKKAELPVINPKAEDSKLKKYVCTVCGYIYDPAKGDPDSGVAPGTPFEKIPADWICPICGVKKDQFEEMK